MDNQELKTLLKAKRSKGANYMRENYDVIKNLILDGESLGSIYEALKVSSTPCPILRSQFYKQAEKHKLTKNHLLPKKVNPVESAPTVLIKTTDAKHDVLNNLNSKNQPIHDSSRDADKLI